MVPPWIVVVGLSLAAALVFAASTSLKHVSAGRIPAAQATRPRALGRFIRATVSHRLWLAGIACDVVGLTLQIVALHLGALSIVQPLLLTSLPFALLIRSRFEHQLISHRETFWAVVLTGALGCFVLLAATPTRATDEPAHGIPAVLAAAVGAVVVATCLVLARRHRHRGHAAAIMGIAVGVIYAGTAALIKTATNIGVRDPLALLTSWPLYAVIVLGAAGLLLSQLTFQAGPLTASLPATASVDPLLSIVIGVVIFQEHLRPGLGNYLLLVLLLLVLGTAVRQLIRAPAEPSPGR